MQSGGASWTPCFPAPTNCRYVWGVYPRGYVLAREKGQKLSWQVLSEPVSPLGQRAGSPRTRRGLCLMRPFRPMEPSAPMSPRPS